MGPIIKPPFFHAPLQIGGLHIGKRHANNKNRSQLLGRDQNDILAEIGQGFVVKETNELRSPRIPQRAVERLAHRHRIRCAGKNSGKFGKRTLDGFQNDDSLCRSQKNGIWQVNDVEHYNGIGSKEVVLDGVKRPTHSAIGCKKGDPVSYLEPRPPTRISWSLPARVARPFIASTSYWPGEAPATSIRKVPLALWV